jgi:hypothetical protein
MGPFYISIYDPKRRSALHGAHMEPAYDDVRIDALSVTLDPDGENDEGEPRKRRVTDGDRYTMVHRCFAAFETANVDYKGDKEAEFVTVDENVPYYRAHKRDAVLAVYRVHIELSALS